MHINRFQAPEPIEPWAPDVFDASEFGFTCVRPVFHPFVEPTPQSEDCLSLNIYVPGEYCFFFFDSIECQNMKF